MSFVTKSLGSLRASCLCRLCSNSRDLTNLMRCIYGEWLRIGRVLIQVGWPLLMRIWSSMIVKGDNQLMRKNSLPQYITCRCSNTSRGCTRPKRTSTMYPYSVLRTNCKWMRSVEWYQLEMELLVNVKPLRWHNTLALWRWVWSTKWPMTILRGTLSEWEVCKAMSIIWILVANVYRIQRRMMEHKGGVHQLPQSTKISRWVLQGQGAQRGEVGEWIAWV